MRCYRCLKEYPSEYEVCPHCGNIATTKDNNSNYLAAGMMLLDRYYVGVALGCGGFGIIYKAYDTMLDVVVAIKEYFPRGMVRRSETGNEVEVCIRENEREYRAGLYRFIAEARTLAKFSKHDNIVNVYNYYELNKTAYIVMEYLEGLSLKQYLDINDGKMSVNDSLWVMQSMAKALMSLHKENILHRDISPDNIFLCSNGKVKLLDFGAARLKTPTDEVAKTIVKVGYAPPEQYRTKEEQGPWTDLYALGATFYRALTGVVPIESIGRLKNDHIKSPKDYVNDSEGTIPDYLNNAIMKLLMLEGKDRFESAEELLEVLEKKKLVSLISSEEKKVRKQKKQKVAAVLFMILPILITIIVWIYTTY